MTEPFKPNPDLQHAPEVTEGYMHSFTAVKWVPYKPNGARQMNRKGRWKALNEYGGWENCETPAEVWPEPIDIRAPDPRVEALVEALRKIANENGASTTDRNLHMKQVARAALAAWEASK